MRATATATVPVPAAKVWEVLSDHEGMANWAPALTATLVRPGTTERNGVGAQRRFKMGPAPEFVEEVTAFEPERRLTYVAVSGIPFRNYVGDVELRPAGDSGTEISYTVSADNRVPVVAAVMANGLLFALKRQLNRA